DHGRCPISSRPAPARRRSSQRGWPDMFLRAHFSSVPPRGRSWTSIMNQTRSNTANSIGSGIRAWQNPHTPSARTMSICSCHRPLAMTRVSVFVLLASTIAAAQPPTDRDVLARIRVEGMERSQAAPVFNHLTIDIGPRLTASPAHKRAVEWTRDRLLSYGLANVLVEPWTFGMGWTLDKLTIEMVEPRYLPLLGYADGWSRSTSGEVVGAPIVVAGKTPEEIVGLAPQLKGA